MATKKPSKGKRFVKVVKNPKTGRTRSVSYGQSGNAKSGGDRIRPGTKKGKLDRQPIWVVKIQMPKTLIADIYTGYREQEMEEPTPVPPTPEAQPADIAAEAPDDIEAAAV
jgi:hypothetical protein